LLLLPIRTDTPVRRRPYVNYALIGLNALIFVVTNVIGRSQFVSEGWGDALKNDYGLFAAKPEFYQFITYQFLHGDIFHLLGNMLFLWVFGNAVNAKMGNAVYLIFYIAGGIFAGVGFASFNSGFVIGASGAIAAVTTAFLALHPRSQVTLFYWLWLFIGTWSVQALFVIGFKIILYDNILMPSLSGGGGVAYSAHLTGYVFGLVVSLGLLLIRALPRDQYDILALWKRAHQRAQMRSTMADPNARARAVYGRVARPVSIDGGSSVPVAAAVPAELIDEVTHLRLEITERLARNDYAGAAERYEALVARHADQCLPRKQMLHVANQLMAVRRYPQAAAAYEKYVQHYPTSIDSEQIRLLLGIIYARYLQQYEPARRHLEQSVDRLTNDQQRQQANEWLEVVRNALGPGPSTA